MSAPAACALSADSLTVRFGDFAALESVDLRVAEGEFLAIVGPNGAGKSTLLRVFLGLLQPNEGSATVFGRPPREAAAELIGYVPQVKSLDRSFPAIAVELVATGLRPRWPWRVGAKMREEAVAALARVGAAHLSDRPVGALSGGELQRVCVARALARRPRLILLDEPAAGMDIQGEAQMCCDLADYRAETGATIVMITHDWGAARRHASRVLLLNRKAHRLALPQEAFSAEALHEAFGHIPAEHVHHGRAKEEK